ncbi:MAG: gamma-glutamylcyclotransferase [Candidatus Saccharibacteria bacterium]|nr:gamma-glutamylcyclotransferase [Candidatus Saccharibacteria bacterium]
MLYFAYGSNLNKHQMHQRCPSAKLLSVGYLNGYTLYYGGECIDWDNKAYLNIAKHDGGQVWGAVYQMSRADIKRLDGFEDVPRDYSRKLVRIHTGAKTLNAYVYLGHKVKRGVPSFKYRRTTLIGARADHLPKNYIASWL